MLPRIVIDFFLNKQPHAPIIQIYSVIKLYTFSGTFSAHHQEFSTVHSALVSFMQVFDYRFQSELGSGHQKPACTCWSLTYTTGRCYPNYFEVININFCTN